MFTAKHSVESLTNGEGGSPPMSGGAKLKKVMMATLMVALPSAAIAGDKVAVRPMQVGLETVRYRQGVATVEMATSDATIDVTPLGFDHGGLTFGVAIFNADAKPANVDVTNILANVGDETLRPLTANELAQKAKTRAMWASIAVAAFSGIAAAAASSSRDYYRGSYSTPRGTYRWTYSAPSASGQVAAAAYVAGGAYGISRIQSQLDRTLEGIGNNAFQLTTIDPGESYAGRIVMTKPKKAKWPQVVHLVIRWNGRDYPFDFDVGNSNRPVPVFADVAVPDAIGTRPSSSDTPATLSPSSPLQPAVIISPPLAENKDAGINAAPKSAGGPTGH
jgi:hypothetical protein